MLDSAIEDEAELVETLAEEPDLGKCTDEQLPSKSSLKTQPVRSSLLLYRKVLLRIAAGLPFH